jgi:hypothetical protein
MNPIHTTQHSIIQTEGIQVNQNTKVLVVLTKVEELQAGSVHRIFNSKEKVQKYVLEQEKKSEHFVNLIGIDRSIEEWEVE